MKFEFRHGLKKDRYKTANKNVKRLTFVFEHVNKYTMNKKQKRICLNGITCRGTHQVKKIKELQCSY